MNTSGADHPHILKTFLVDTSEKAIEEFMFEYSFSEWYDIVHEKNCTITSFLFTRDELINTDKIDEFIQTLPNQCCFARVDVCSAKPKTPYRSSKEIIESLQKSERTSPYYKNPEMKIIIREWVDNIKDEFRCFFHQNKIRGITGFNILYQERLNEIIQFANKVCYYTEYADFTLDLAFINNKLVVIEINTPVYLFATSGEFDLENAEDFHILLGEYQPDIINYPVVKYYCADDL